MYRPRAMPSRYMKDAPEIVRANVLDLIRIVPAAPLDFDVILKPAPAPFRDVQVVGVDFDCHGAQGCHFFLQAHEARAYRDRNRKKRVAWSDLPEATRQAIVRYLESE